MRCPLIHAGVMILVLLSGCAGSGPGRGLPSGGAAYEAIPAMTAAGSLADYRIGPLDQINVTVFEEADLTLKEVQVDASGNIAMPLIGRVQASGRTTSELAGEIEHRLGERYLVRPQVTVAVSQSVSQKVIVQGEVTEPGVYELKGPTTLLEAISLAKGESRVAALRRVSIFRVKNGSRFGAVFDIEAIRGGQQPDPAIIGNDIVVVGVSRSKSVWRDIVQTAPVLSIAAFLTR